MSPRTHISPSLLASFASGHLPNAPGVTVSAHLETCSGCRAKVSAFEEAEGQLLASSPPAPMAQGALSHLLARIDKEPAPAPERPRDLYLADIKVPQAAARAGFGARRWLRPGLWVAPVRAEPINGWRTFLLRAPAATTVPTHSHRGGEMIAVLSGAFHDGRTYTAGDFAEDVAGHDHRLKVTSDGPCACLVSIRGRVQWRGWAKMVGPLLGM